MKIRYQKSDYHYYDVLNNFDETVDCSISDLQRVIISAFSSIVEREPNIADEVIIATISYNGNLNVEDYLVKTKHINVNVTLDVIREGKKPSNINIHGYDLRS